MLFPGRTENSGTEVLRLISLRCCLHLWLRWWTLGFRKMRGISCLAGDRLKWLCSMEQVSCFSDVISWKYVETGQCCHILGLLLPVSVAVSGWGSLIATDWLPNLTNFLSGGQRRLFEFFFKLINLLHRLYTGCTKISYKIVPATNFIS
jgi:hypothetical protein